MAAPERRQEGEPPEPLTLYTVGHSNHEPGHFLGLLTRHGVEVVVDVRSSPDATFLPCFERAPITRLLRDSQIKYLFLGAELGGRPAGDEYYDAEGRVLYGLWAQSKLFREGLNRLVTGCGRYRVAIMCSEEDPTYCHRRLLVGRALGRRYEVELRHIRKDGHIDSEETSRAVWPGSDQMSLFQPGGDVEWKSIRSVSHRSRLGTSSPS